MYEEIKKKFNDLERLMSDPQIVKDVNKFKDISRQHANLKEVIGLIYDWEKINKDLEENNHLLATETNDDLKNMAKEELLILEKKSDELKKQIEIKLHTTDLNDKKDVIMEIRAGTGGDESALFTADLFRMYSRFAERQGWKVNILSSNRIGIGGFKEIIFEINGKNVFATLKYERGIHRVQRVPETEKQGRIHTSAATVAVLPQAEEIDLEIKPEDLRIDTFASSGPGGQKVNTTNSAVRITHLPTVTVVQCQDQKSQHQNKEKAMRILRSRILDNLQAKQQQQEAAERKLQVGSGDRSEKIRTYNFPQDRVTDHRIKQSWHALERIMDGEIDQIINELKKVDQQL
ncbi:MAG: peptide chain release factor 1 [Candidatus Falkowbacteria bacterium]|nr:peptide chain release factor 1 [Candidatus Falkowbacteria bacterium]